MKIYCNQQDNEDLEFFKSIVGTDYFVAATDLDTDWYIRISDIFYERGIPYMDHTCVLKEDVDNAYKYTGLTETEIHDVLDDCDVICPVSEYRLVRPVDLLTYAEIRAMLMEGTHE